MSWENIIKRSYEESIRLQRELDNKKYKDLSEKFLEEIKAEGGVLGKRHLINKFNMNISNVEIILTRMIMEGLISRRGDLYAIDSVKKRYEFKGTPVDYTGYCRTCGKNVSQGDTCPKRGKKENPQLRNVDTCPMKV